MPLDSRAPLRQRRRERTYGPVGPWQATIHVDAVQTNHGRQTSLPHDWLFEVSAEWVGPPAIGFPAASGPVASRDVVVLEGLELAVQTAKRALEAFSRGGHEPPDLRDFVTRHTGAFGTK